MSHTNPTKKELVITFRVYEDENKGVNIETHVFGTSPIDAEKAAFMKMMQGFLDIMSAFFSTSITMAKVTRDDIQREKLIQEGKV